MSDPTAWMPSLELFAALRILRHQEEGEVRKWERKREQLSKYLSKGGAFVKSCNAHFYFRSSRTANEPTGRRLPWQELLITHRPFEADRELYT